MSTPSTPHVLASRGRMGVATPLSSHDANHHQHQHHRDNVLVHPLPANLGGGGPQLVAGAHRLRGARPYMEDRHVVIYQMRGGKEGVVPPPAHSSAERAPGLGGGGGGSMVHGGHHTVRTTLDVEAGTCVFLGVYDGHNGAYTAEKACREVQSHLIRHEGYHEARVSAGSADFLVYREHKVSI